MLRICELGPNMCLEILKLICKQSRVCLERCVCAVCPALFAAYSRPRRRRCTSFGVGLALAQAYYYYVLNRIPFPYRSGVITSYILSVLMGVFNTISTQVRCICLLIVPMYCGTAGRGVLKVVVLTYVVAGPITNMGMNAREVVRVSACTMRLARALSAARHARRAAPLRATARHLPRQLQHLNETLQSVKDIVEPIKHEVESAEELRVKQLLNDYVDSMLRADRRSQRIEIKFQSNRGRQVMEEAEVYRRLYERKLEYRCESVAASAVATCVRAFATTHAACLRALPPHAAPLLCLPLQLRRVCNILPLIRYNDSSCDSTNQMDPGFEEAYVALKAAQSELTDKMKDVKVQYEVIYERELQDIQAAKETGERVIHAFEEKTTMMGWVALALNVYVALVLLRVAAAAARYHERYLTCIAFDNVYVTRYFKRLDERRRRRGDVTLLPLKKMERSKYIEVGSVSCAGAEHERLLAQVLKVMLEVVTATTFVMLDRLFYEALDVVRQHAQQDPLPNNPRDLNIEVEGTGILASLLRKMLLGVRPEPGGVRGGGDGRGTHTSEECVPRPRAMSPRYYVQIYGGYLWILLLLYLNPFTLQLRRLTCSYFYPRREKQRILHLYNDILKKRMKMHKTLRRKAVQAVRAHYLSGENLLSLRMRFPRALGWLRALPAARMTCLICGETEPRNEPERWHACLTARCPFVFCVECWREAGARCLACEPCLAELSDMDSLSDDQHPNY